MQRKILKTIVLFTLTLMAAFISPKGAYAQSLEDVLDVIDLYYNSYSDSIVTIPDDLYQEYALDLGENASYEIVSGNSASISEEGVISPKITYTYVIGLNGGSGYRPTYTEGTTIIDISDGTDSRQITVNVINYARKYSGDLMDQVAEQIMNEYDSDYERLEAATKYTAHNYSYGVSASSCIGMVMLGAGDCWASTDMICELCDRMGIKNYARSANNDSGAGSGHYNTAALCDGIVYVAEAGYTGTKPRAYHVTAEQDGFSKKGTTTVYQYDGFDENVVIPEGVTTIGNDNRCVFSYSYTDVKSVYIPSTVSEITRFAFGYTNSLTKIEVSEDNPYFTSVDGVLYTKDMKTIVAYPGGKTLTSFTLPDTVTTLGKTCFYYVKCVNEIVLPDHLEVIEEGALFQSNMNRIDIPATVTRIDENALVGVKYIYAHGMTTNLVDGFVSNTSVIYGLADSSYIQYAMNHEMLYEIYTEEELSADSIDLSNAEISGMEDSYPASSDGVKPVPVVTVNGKELRQNTEFTVSYSNTDREGDATLTIRGVGKYTGSISVSYKITKIKVSAPVITYADDSVPEQSNVETWLRNNVTIEYAGEELKYGTDYKYYSEHDDDGNVTGITIQYTGAYSGYSFLYNLALGTCDVDSQEYTGEPVVPDLTVKSSHSLLEKDVDYIVSCSNNTEIGTAEVKITGIGKYFGSLEKKFEIIEKKMDISEATVTGLETSYLCSIDGVRPEPEVAYEGMVLEKDKDYILAYSNIDQEGSATLTITGKGLYKGIITWEYTLTKISVSNPTITYLTDIVPEKSEIRDWVRDNVIIKYEGKELIYGTDYYYYYYGSDENGNISHIIIQYTGAYSGYSFLYNLTLGTCDIDSQDYIGAPVIPDVTVKVNERTLKKDVDYVVYCNNNIELGTADIKITGTGKYFGSLEGKFEIIKKTDLSNAEITGLEEKYLYTGEAIRPEPIVTIDGTELVLNKDYTLSYSNNISEGSDAQITITGIDDYKGMIEKTFAIFRIQATNPMITYSSTDIPNEDNLEEWLEDNVKIEIDGKTLTYNTDFSYYYYASDSYNNINFIYLQFLGSYSGYYTLTNIQTVDFDDIEYMAYTGKALTPESELVGRYDTLIKDVDYKVTYVNNVDKGIANINYIGIGGYYGLMTDEFMIVEEEEIPRTVHYVRGIGGIVSYYDEELKDWCCHYVDENGCGYWARLYDGTKVYSVELGCDVVWSKDKCAFVLESGTEQPDETTSDDITTPGETKPDETTSDNITTPGETKPGETTSDDITTPVETKPAETMIGGMDQNETTSGTATQYATTKDNTSQKETTAKKAVKETTGTVSDIKTGKAKISKAVKKAKSSKKMKVYLKKKVFGANGYQIKVYKTKKSKKAILTKTTTKLKITLKTNKMRGRKNLYVRVRAYQNVNGKKVYGKWSAVKKTTTK